MIAPDDGARRLTGRNLPAPEPRLLRAGPVSALLEGADLRHIRVGDAELVQRVYVAVRDAPWNTIPATFDDWRIDTTGERFVVRFLAAHRHADIDFRWRGSIEGFADGTIRYVLDGVCHGAFRYSKIGFNVHHGLAESVGRPFRAATTTGELTGTLPASIEPQRIVNGTLTGMYEPFRELALEVAPGLEARIGLEGDLLELQDHRNWTDGNFKSYGTPLALGFPFDAVDGQVIRQVLTVGFRGTVPAGRPASPLTLRLGAVIAPSVPRIGYSQPGHGRPLSASEADRLRPLRPDHLRVEINPTLEGLAELDRAVADATQLGGVALELAVFANDGSGPALEELARRLRTTGVRVARVLVYFARDGFSAVSGTTPPTVVRLVRDHLEPAVGAVPFAGGTNQSFADVNRDRPSDPVQTAICFAISPTVHAADDASIIENIAVQRDVVRFARSFAGLRDICVGPVTIATRFGPYPAGPSGPDDLPAAVDVRQASLLGAAWTLGSLAALLGGPVDSLTYYETTGWLGVVETDEGSRDPRFPSRPGDTFPLAHVLADVLDRRDAAVVDVWASDPLRATGIALRSRAGIRVLAANLTPSASRVSVHGLPAGPGTVRVLDLDSAERAVRDPGGFRADTRPIRIPADLELEMDLGPYATACIDAGVGR